MQDPKDLRMAVTQVCIHFLSNLQKYVNVQILIWIIFIILINSSTIFRTYIGQESAKG